MQKITLSLVLYTFLFSGVVFSEEKANDPQDKSVYLKEKPADQPNIPKIEYPELPTDVPEVKELIDMANLVIDHFNQGIIQQAVKPILQRHQEGFERKMGPKIAEDLRTRRKAGKEMDHGNPFELCYMKHPSTGELELKGIFWFGARPLQIEGKEEKVLLPMIMITIENGKVKSITSELFGDYLDSVTFIVFDSRKTTFHILSYENEKETPYVQWDVNGKPHVEKRKQPVKNYNLALILFSGEVKPSQGPAAPAKK